MVLSPARSAATALLAVTVSTLPGTVRAQTLPEVAPAIQRDDPEYDPAPIRIGPVQVTLAGDARIEYDDNIFALPEDVSSDGIVVLSAAGSATHTSGTLTTRFDASITARRFFEETSQNAEAGRVAFGLAWEPRQTEVFSFNASWDRTIEDRGDPEARQNADLGPRLIDISSLQAGYRRARGRIVLEADAEATKFDAVDSFDDDRDFTVYNGTVKLGVRAGGRILATTTAFVSARDFRLELDSSGINRDATIYGARAGIDFVPGGFLEGNISAGIFRNEPEDPQLVARTGLSLAGKLTYRPRRRTAIILNAFSGDVATFRGGASGRTDTILRLVWQQEVRHNFFASASVGFRESDFIDADVTEETVIASLGSEYLLSRNLALVGQVNFGSRSSDLPEEEFERVRASIGIRARF